MKSPWLFSLILTSVVAFSQDETPESIVAPQAKPEQLGTGFQFTEGPAADREGNVYFTDQPNDRILKWNAESGEITTFLQPCGRSNGLFFDPDGSLLACADEKNELWSISPDGAVTVLIKEYEGKRLNGPNDLWVHPDGSIYFTDPFYKRPWWDHETQEQEKRCVYRLSSDRKTLERVAQGFEQPNGIIGTPDGKTLYTADIGDRKTYRFQIQEDGSLTDREIFCEHGSDGMTLDNEGNVYLTGDGVLVFNSHGKQIDHIQVDERWTANVCFGGKDRRMLFITASKGVYGIQTRTQGVY